MKCIRTQFYFTALAAVLAITSARSADINPAEARAIAKEAYIYGFPLVDSYRIQHTYFVDRASPEYNAPWNQLVNTPRLLAPAPKGPFILYMRLYWPKEEATEGKWTAPKLQKI